jgi:hypothetical protein
MRSADLYLKFLLVFLHSLDRECYEILLDETIDISREEKIAFCLRFVDYLLIQEHFIKKKN